MQTPTISSIKTLSPELQLVQINQLELLKLSHPVGEALIALQGAQLLQWRPQHCDNSLLWLSEIEGYKQGKAIRGGIPICFPWFNNNGTPAHGFARITTWQLAEYDIQSTQVRLVFHLFWQEQLQAELIMSFTDKCELEFINYHPQAQLALHSYFNLSHIEQTHVQGLGTSCFNSLTQQTEQVSDPRQINEHVDCIYPTSPKAIHYIQDQGWQRTIQLEHKNATDIVVWNPWHKATSAMSSNAYQTMLCVETARISQRLAVGEKVSLVIKI